MESFFTVIYTLCTVINESKNSYHEFMLVMLANNFVHNSFINNLIILFEWVKSVQEVNRLKERSM